MAEIAIRFVAGGILVCLFAVLGEVFRPKTFAGMFGAAPSVALVSLGLAFAWHGPEFAVAAARTMVLGAVGLAAYGIVSSILIERHWMPVWIGAALCWGVWLMTAFALWFAVARPS